MSGDFKTLLASARLPERTVQICLRGDLVAEHEAAERELELAQQAPSDSLAGNGAAALAERIRDLEAEMREASVPFRLRALPRAQWRDLVAAHPPRRGEDGEVVEADKGIMLDVETFYDDMIRRCLVDPAPTDEQWQQLCDVLTDAQYGDLSLAAWLLNRTEVDVPFSRAASRMKRATAAE